MQLEKDKIEMDLTQIPVKIRTRTETCSDFCQQIPISVSPVAFQYTSTIQNYGVQLVTTINTQSEMLFYM